MLHWNVPIDNGGAPVTVYTVKYRTLHGHVQRGPWRNVNVSHTETWYRLELDWETVFELTVTAWNRYGESSLDLDQSSCVVVIGKGIATSHSPYVPIYCWVVLCNIRNDVTSVTNTSQSRSFLLVTYYTIKTRSTIIIRYT